MYNVLVLFNTSITDQRSNFNRGHTQYKPSDMSRAGTFAIHYAIN